MRTPEGLLYIDRTRRATDMKCRRRRYILFEWGGRGLSPKQRSRYLEFGSIQHDSMADLLMGRDIEEVVATAVARFRTAIENGEISWNKPHRTTEQLVFLECQLRGWHRWVLPQILREYTVHRVEGEVIYDFLNCRLGAKPDVLLRRISDGSLWYIEWKTTGSMTPEWFASWHKAVQLHAGALGVARTLGEPLAGAIVFALYKGFENKKADRQESIFAYGYVPRGKRDENEISIPVYEYKPGLVKEAIWHTKTPKQWIEEMPEDVLSAQFGDTGPVYLDEDQCESWLRQASYRETEIDTAVNLLAMASTTPEGRQEILDRTFPQNFDECTPSFGSPCDAVNFCFMRHVQDDPIKSGLFEMRRPHHTTDPVWIVQQQEASAA